MGQEVEGGADRHQGGGGHGGQGVGSCDRIAYRGGELVGGECAVHQVAGSAVGDRCPDGGRVVDVGQHEHARRFAGGGHSIDDVHLYVEQHNIRTHPVGQFDGLLTVARLGHHLKI
jgi:hypothetical protein